MKKIVHYRALASDIRFGAPVLLYPIDHPSDLVSNTKMARTSPVELIEEDGVFETRNTRYVPA